MASGPSFLNHTVCPGETLVFDASQTYDPDHPSDNSRLDFQWFQYIELTKVMPSILSIGRLTLRPLSPLTGSNGTAAFDDSGFQNITIGSSVEVTMLSGDTSLSYQLIL